MRACVCARVCVCVCVCVCVRERERERETQSHHSGVYSASEIVLIIAACWQTHTSIIIVFVTWLCSPLRLELMVKLRTLLTVFTFNLKAKARDYGKGHYISDAACGVRPITMHCASWPIRADCACRKEGLCRIRSVWERRGIEDLQKCIVFEKLWVFFTLKGYATPKWKCSHYSLTHMSFQPHKRFVCLQNTI